MANFIFGWHVAFAFVERHNVNHLGLKVLKSADPPHITGPPWPAEVLLIEAKGFLQEYNTLCKKKLMLRSSLLAQLVGNEHVLGRDVLDYVMGPDCLRELRGG